MFYFYIFLVAFVLSALLTVAVGKIAFYFRVVDEPGQVGSLSRKIHIQTTPLLGGLAIFFSYFIILFFLFFKIRAFQYVQKTGVIGQSIS